MWLFYFIINHYLCVTNKLIYIFMYTLRSFGNDGIETNESIGEEYQVISREVNYEKFREAYELFWNNPHVADLDSESNELTKNTFAFLVTGRGSKLIPLYKDRIYYIMTDSGNTFSKMTYKG